MHTDSLSLSLTHTPGCHRHTDVHRCRKVSIAPANSIAGEVVNQGHSRCVAQGIHHHPLSPHSSHSLPHLPTIRASSTPSSTLLSLCPSLPLSHHYSFLLLTLPTSSPSCFPLDPPLHHHHLPHHLPPPHRSGSGLSQLHHGQETHDGAEVDIVRVLGVLRGGACSW